MEDTQYSKMPDLYDYDKPRDLGYHSPESSLKDNGFLALFELLNAADWAQTQQISRNPQKYYEQPFPVGSSQLIGKHPSSAGVTALMGAEAAGYPLAVKHLDEPWKTFFQVLAGAAKASAVSGNKSIGLDAIRW